MTTASLSISDAWTKVANATDTELLVTWETPVTVAFATTAADAAPTDKGHRLNRESAVSRAALGSGYVWARTIPGSVPSSIKLKVSK